MNAWFQRPVAAPADLADALDANDAARKQWDAITPKARAAWVEWITSAKREETRARRTARTVERLAAGARRPSD